jgi:hypothetical protein
MSDPVVYARGLTKAFGEGTQQVWALRGVDLDIGEGEFIALVGPSGSGKTTLLNLVGALDAPTAGELVVLGKAIATLSKRERAGRLRGSGSSSRPTTSCPFSPPWKTWNSSWNCRVGAERHACHGGARRAQACGPG